jgi:hypothetical protein
MAGEQTTGAPAAAGAPQGTSGGEQSSLLTEGAQGAATQTEGKGTEGAPAQGGEAKPGDDGKGTQAPETYEFKAPEGVELDTDAVSEFSALAKELKLPADQAQKVADIAIKMAQRQAEQTAAVVKGWADQSRTDKEFGGDNLDANLAVAKKAVGAFGSEEFTRLLNETGIGNHPEFIRFAYRAGKAMSDDTFVKGGNPTSTNNVPFEKRLYPNMT